MVNISKAFMVFVIGCGLMSTPWSGSSQNERRGPAFYLTGRNPLVQSLVEFPGSKEKLIAWVLNAGESEVK
jgi:hypothetical protein